MNVYTRNSMYQIDRVRQRRRRVFGDNPPTASQEMDGLWKTYAWLDEPQLDRSMRYSYYEGPGRFVLTSPVTEIAPCSK